MYHRFDNVYILESVEGPKKLAQYSFIGFDPKLTLCIKNGEAIVQNKKTREETRDKVADPLQIVRKLVSGELALYGGLRLIGGAIGYISYDAVRYWERLPETTVDDLGFPDIEMGIFDDGIIFDRENGLAYYYYQNEDRLR